MSRTIFVSSRPCRSSAHARAGLRPKPGTARAATPLRECRSPVSGDPTGHAHIATEHGLQQRLALLAAHFQFIRQRPGKARMISGSSSGTRLKAVMHRCAIDLHEDVVRQVALRVEHGRGIEDRPAAFAGEFRHAWVSRRRPAPHEAVRLIHHREAALIGLDGRASAHPRGLILQAQRKGPMRWPAIAPMPIASGMASSD